MIKVIIGKEFNTSFGKFVIPDNQTEIISVNETINYGGILYKVKNIVFSSRPNGKWSIELRPNNI